ncbi:hypothetical protein OsJ_06029 [Oryza sativa Japonica Group]|uniref:Plant heme peroxidase family profile domain-containing protein n=1 Tax=Oryza sativa subsp. japonica TaxID=39947 RepID=A3A4Y2_ORYSJ|nr:hypothetical protein OsJ_06029 [Oryza sativa Japonica Group]
MASRSSWHCCLLAFFLLSSAAGAAYGQQLSTTFYAASCPTLQVVVRATVLGALLAERRMGASLVRLFFHDCFVQGCDASILLDDVPATSFVGEKTAFPNVNSVRGYDVIDQIKRNVELLCPGVVSCADIVALAARDSTALTQNVFDNAYYRNLLAQRGLLHSDQELFNGGSQDALVQQYSSNPALFAADFAAAMIKMGNIKPLTGAAGQIRRSCRAVNSS